ncbi:MAG TPA: UvrD-helicase domain-containing protein [Candidatus Xenobia bacterium]
MSNLLEALNPPQQEAVLYSDGPLLVLAGAGSGKTRVLTHKIAHMVAEKMYAPNHILAVTFTNKAAGEMKERINHLTGSVKIPWMGTFHSICVRILRHSGEAIGIPRTYTIYDRDDQVGMVKDVMKVKNIDEENLTPSNVLARISKAKSRLETPDEFARRAEDPDATVITTVYREYQARLYANGALDFDDLLMRTADLFEKHPNVLQHWREQFEYTLIDEYQDVNYAQHVLVQQIARPTGRITAVGDDDQSIYSFRGSDVELILRFEKDFAGAKVIKLEQNYRCTGSILDLANHVIAQNVMRNNKVLWTTNQKGDRPALRRLHNARTEARWIIREMRRHQREWRRPWGDFAVLYRTNAQSRPLEEALIEESIPYRMVGGVRFFERREIKDLMGYLWVLANPQDEVNLKRIINTPPRGIGVTTMRRLEETAVRERKTFTEILQEPGRAGDMTPRTLASIREVVTLIAKMRTLSETAPVAEVIKKIIDAISYRDYLENDNPGESQARLANIEELVNLASEYTSTAEEPSLRNFLAEKALVSDTDAYDEKAGAVTLMTLHAAKGLEFPVVFLAGLEEDLFPAARSRDNPPEMEEERRLCYVGMTRARENLYLTSAQLRRVYGEEQERLLSQFVRDLPPELVDVQEELGMEEEVYVPRYRPETVPIRREEPTPGWQGSTSVKTTTLPPYTGRKTPKPTAKTSKTSKTSSSRSSGPVRKVSPTSIQPAMTRRPTPPRPVETEPLFHAGDQVQHKVFGVGLVEKAERDVMTVNFSGTVKKIMATFLTNVGETKPRGLDAGDLRPGDRIRHPHYGEGVLKELEYRNGHPHVVLMYADEVRTFPVAGTPLELA